MAFSKQRECDFVIVLLITALFLVPETTTENIDCNGKAFHCVNSTHFKICVDFGGVSKTVDDFLIPCPPMTVCTDNNYFECEYQITTTPATVFVQGDVTNKTSTTPVSTPWELFEVTTLHPVSNHERSIELSVSDGTKTVDIVNKTLVNVVLNETITDKNQFTVSEQTITKEESNDLSTNDGTLSTSFASGAIAVENYVTTESEMSNNLFNTVITTTSNAINGREFTATSFNPVITESSKINDLTERTTKPITSDMYEATITTSSFIRNADNLSKQSSLIEKIDDLRLSSTLEVTTENNKVSLNDTIIYSTEHVTKTSTNTTAYSSLFVDTTERYLPTSTSKHTTVPSSTIRTENLTNAEKYEGTLTTISELNLASTLHDTTVENINALSATTITDETISTTTAANTNAIKNIDGLNDYSFLEIRAHTNKMDEISSYSQNIDFTQAELISTTTENTTTENFSVKSGRNDLTNVEITSSDIIGLVNNTVSHNDTNKYIRVTDLDEITTQVPYTKAPNNKDNVNLLIDTKPYFSASNLSIPKIDYNVNLASDVTFPTTSSLYHKYTTENDVPTTKIDFDTNEKNTLKASIHENNLPTLTNTEFLFSDGYDKESHYTTAADVALTKTVEKHTTTKESDSLSLPKSETVSISENLNNKLHETTTKYTSDLINSTKSTNFNLSTLNGSDLYINIENKTSNNKTENFSVQESNTTNSYMANATPLQQIEDLTSSVKTYSDEVNFTTTVNNLIELLMTEKYDLSLTLPTESAPVTEIIITSSSNMSGLTDATESYVADRTNDINLINMNHLLPPKIDDSLQNHPTTENIIKETLGDEFLSSVTNNTYEKSEEYKKDNNDSAATILIEPNFSIDNADFTESSINLLKSIVTNDESEVPNIQETPMSTILNAEKLLNTTEKELSGNEVYLTEPSKIVSESKIMHDLRDQSTISITDLPNIQETPMSTIVKTENLINTTVKELSRNKVNLTELSKKIPESKVTLDIHDQTTITNTNSSHIQESPQSTTVNTEKLHNRTGNELLTNEVHFSEPSVNILESIVAHDVYELSTITNKDLQKMQESPLSTIVTTEKLINATSESSGNEINLTEPSTNLSESKVTHDVYDQITINNTDVLNMQESPLSLIVSTEKLLNSTENETSRNEVHFTKLSVNLSESKVTHVVHGQISITNKDLSNKQETPMSAIINIEKVLNKTENKLSINNSNLKEPSVNLILSNYMDDVYDQATISNTDASNIQQPPPSAIRYTEKFPNTTANESSRNKVNLTEPSLNLSESKVMHDVDGQITITYIDLPNTQESLLSTIVNTENLVNTTENDLTRNEMKFLSPNKISSESKFTLDQIIITNSNLPNTQESPLSTISTTVKLLNTTENELSRNKVILTEPSTASSESIPAYDRYDQTTITNMALPNIQVSLLKSATLRNTSANELIRDHSYLKNLTSQNIGSINKPDISYSGSSLHSNSTNISITTNSDTTLQATNRDDEEQTINLIHVHTATSMTTPRDVVNVSSTSEDIVNNIYTITDSQNQPNTVNNVLDGPSHSYTKDGMVENVNLLKGSAVKITLANEYKNTVMKDLKPNIFINNSGGVIHDIYYSTSIGNTVTENSFSQTHKYFLSENVTESSIFISNNLEINQFINSSKANNMVSTSVVDNNSNQSIIYKTALDSQPGNDRKINSRIDDTSLTKDNLTKTLINDLSISSSVNYDQTNVSPLHTNLIAQSSTASVNNMFLDSQGTVPLASKVQLNKVSSYTANTLKTNTVQLNESYLPLKSNLTLKNENDTKENIITLTKVIEGNLDTATLNKNVSEQKLENAVRYTDEHQKYSTVSDREKLKKKIENSINNSRVTSNINYFNNATESANISSHEILPVSINKENTTTNEVTTRLYSVKPNGLNIHKDTNSTKQVNTTRLISEVNIAANLYKDNGASQRNKLNVEHEGLGQITLNNVSINISTTKYQNNSYEISPSKTRKDVNNLKVSNINIAEDMQSLSTPVLAKVNKEPDKKEQISNLRSVELSNENMPRNDERAKLQFNCNHRHRGKYSDKNDCQNFYICTGRNEPIFGKCPNNTVFSEISKQCTKNLSHCIRNNQFQCISTGRYIDIFSDEFYYICAKKAVGYVRFKLKCQKGYHLDKSELKCILDLFNGSTSKEDSSNTDSEKSLSESKSKEDREFKIHKTDFECKKEGKFVYPGDCRKYYQCTKNGKSNFRRKIKKCDSDEVFNDKKRKCVDDESYECNE